MLVGRNTASISRAFSLTFSKTKKHHTNKRLQRILWKTFLFQLRQLLLCVEKKIVSDKLPCALQSRGVVSHFDLTQWRVYFSLLSPQHSVCGIKWYTSLNQFTSQFSSIILYCSFYLCIRIFFPVFSPFLSFTIQSQNHQGV